MKTYKFRLYPSKATVQKMLDTLELCRQTYNTLLGELQAQDVIDRSQIQGIIPDLKICDSRFRKLYSKTMQYECYRLFSNLRGLVESKKEGIKVGSLRFKGKGWFKTFTYNQSGYKLIETSRRLDILELSKIGDIPIRCHRNIQGVIKQVTVKREASGKWFASIVSDEQKTILPHKIETVVGIDVGLDNLVYDSDGNSTKNPRHLKQNEEWLAHVQRILSRKKNGSNNRTKWKIKVARQHEKIANIRSDFLHKLSHYYVENYDAVGVEDMAMTVEGDIFAKSKSDASWGKLRQMIAYKAESAGKLLVPVATRGTTQRCSQCQTIVHKELWDRIHNCPACGFVALRDYNSALEIKRLALIKIGLELPESTLAEMEQAVPSLKQEALTLKYQTV